MDETNKVTGTADSPATDEPWTARNDTATPNPTRAAAGGKAAGANKRADRAMRDEGESQSKFLQPSEGGSYRKQPDGSLRRAEKPTQPPSTPAPKKVKE